MKFIENIIAKAVGKLLTTERLIPIVNKALKEISIKTDNIPSTDRPLYTALTNFLTYNGEYKKLVQACIDKTVSHEFTLLISKYTKTHLDNWYTDEKIKNNIRKIIEDQHTEIHAMRKKSISEKQALLAKDIENMRHDILNDPDFLMKLVATINNFQIRGKE